MGQEGAGEGVSCAKGYSVGLENPQHQCRSNSRNAFFAASGFTWAYLCVVRKLRCPIRSLSTRASMCPARSDPKLCLN